VTWVLVIVSGAIGALARYGVIGAVQAKARDPRPWGTFTVNMSGAAVLGLIAGAGPSGWWVIPVTAGFLGGYTTFSTWIIETIYLAEGGGSAAARTGLLNLLGTFVVGVFVAGVAYLVGAAL